MNQHERIIRYMRRNGSLTSLEAAHNMNITKLTTRISEMRKMGIKFVEVWENNREYKRYSLAQNELNRKLLKERGWIE